MKRLASLKMKMTDFFQNQKDKNIEMKWMRNPQQHTWNLESIYSLYLSDLLKEESILLDFGVAAFGIEKEISESSLKCSNVKSLNK